MIATCILVLLPSIFIHFFFEETYIEEESHSSKKSLLKIYSVYKVFLQPKFRYFRTFFFMVIFYQGFNFFLAGYNYELINKGFSRDTMNTIDNLNIIFQIAAVYFLGKYANYWGFARSFQINFVLMLICLLYLWIWFPVTLVPIIITSFFIGLFSQWENLISSELNAHFP